MIFWRTKTVTNISSFVFLEIFYSHNQSSVCQSIRKFQHFGHYDIYKKKEISAWIFAHCQTFTQKNFSLVFCVKRNWHFDEILKYHEFQFDSKSIEKWNHIELSVEINSRCKDHFDIIVFNFRCTMSQDFSSWKLRLITNVDVTSLMRGKWGLIHITIQYIMFGWISFLWALDLL